MPTQTQPQNPIKDEDRIEYIDSHIDFLLDAKSTFVRNIGLGTIAHDEAVMRLLNEIDIIISSEEADRDVCRFNSGAMMQSIPPKSRNFQPNLDQRESNLRADGYDETMVSSDRQLYAGQSIGLSILSR